MTTTKARVLVGVPLAIFGWLVFARAAPLPASAPPANPVDRWPGRDGNPAYEAFIPAGDTMNDGRIYDPSITYSTDGKTGWLVYSIIRTGPKYAKQIAVGPYRETHLAKSTDGGKTWTFVQALNQSADDSIKNYDGQKIPGLWRYEAPSIVHDPDDPESGWKVFVHCYFWNLQNDRMPAYGWIAVQTAADPAGQWTTPKPLFGSDRFPPKPYDTTPVNVNTLDPSLKGTLVYSEPGAFYHNGTIYLSLTCLEKNGPERIVLLALESRYQNLNYWSYLGTLVTNGDAQQLGYRRFDGSAITEQAGRTFLMVTPDSGSAQNAGTMAIEFSDLSAAKLKRDANGRLLIQKQLHVQQEYPSRAGARQGCFDEHNTYGGVIMPQVITKEAAPGLHLFSTRQSLIDPIP